LIGLHNYFKFVRGDRGVSSANSLTIGCSIQEILHSAKIQSFPAGDDGVLDRCAGCFRCHTLAYMWTSKVDRSTIVECVYQYESCEVGTTWAVLEPRRCDIQSQREVSTLGLTLNHQESEQCGVRLALLVCSKKMHNKTVERSGVFLPAPNHRLSTGH
jgi:hypothetical protein